MSIKATIIHIEDEIRKNSGLWNYVRGAISEAISDENLESFKKIVISDEATEHGPQKVFTYQWPNSNGNCELQIATFSCAAGASEFLERLECENLFFILDTRNQVTNDDVLPENVDAVRPHVNDATKNLRIFSAYCDAVSAHYSREQKTRLGEEVIVPSEWNLSGTDRLPLSDLMIKKTDSETLRTCLFGWMESLSLLEFEVS